MKSNNSRCSHKMDLDNSTFEKTYSWKFSSVLSFILTNTILGFLLVSSTKNAPISFSIIIEALGWSGLLSILLWGIPKKREEKYELSIWSIYLWILGASLPLFLWSIAKNENFWLYFTYLTILGYAFWAFAFHLIMFFRNGCSTKGLFG